MAADTQNALSKVDSHVEEPKERPTKRRGSSLHADVFNMADLGEWPSSPGSPSPYRCHQPLLAASGEGPVPGSAVQCGAEG